MQTLCGRIVFAMRNACNKEKKRKEKKREYKKQNHFFNWLNKNNK